MLFNSFTFAVFFVGVLAMYYLPLPWKVRKFNLIWQSYLFYMAWNPPFVLLLMLSTVVDFWAGWLLDRVQSPGRRKLLLVLSLVLNLGMISYFKYGNFLLTNFTLLMHQFGVNYHPARMDIFLPIGISFYTFVTLTYTFDVYSRKMRAWNSFLDYCLYVTFFPHLVAGPIIRAYDFLGQLATPRWASARQMGWGLSLLVVGLFEKMVIADGLLAPIVERVFDAPAGGRFLGAWTGAFAFAGQIFCDFAGYSTCAIGVSLCLGIAIMDNFHFPYGAVGFSDFWQRWHISLSSFLRDYLYIPLGGNRKGPVRTYVNLMLTMLIGGLWHGASWTFVVWGGLHGAYLIVERWIVKILPAGGPLHSRPVRAMAAVVTFLLICVTWVFFRARTFPKAFSLVGSMFGHYPATQGELVTTAQMLVALYAAVALVALHWSLRDTTLEQVADRCPWWLRSALLAAMIVAIAMSPGEDRAFIYFAF